MSPAHPNRKKKATVTTNTVTLENLGANKTYNFKVRAIIKPNNITDTGAFSPDATVTRGQTVTFLWRAAGLPAPGADNPFSDLASDAYYHDAVLWAVAENITNGMTATTFGPDELCTRGQIVTMLHRDLG